MFHRRSPLAVFLLALLAAPLPAQRPGEPLCGRCHTTGRVEHPHKAKDLEREKDVLLCSAFMESDPEALGLDWIPCPEGKTPSVHAKAVRAFEAEMKRRREWLEARRAEVDERTRTECVHIETEHFLLSWDIPEIKVGRKVLRKHDAAHLYARRAEELYRTILELHDLDERYMMGTKIRLVMLESQRAARAVAPRMTDLPIRGGQKVSKIGPQKSCMVSWDDPEKIRGKDEYRHQFFVHSVSHHIYHDIRMGRQYRTWLFKRWGWLYEGLAFYLEQRLFGPPRTTCSQEGGGFSQHREKSWEALVKRLVQSGDYPSFQDVIQKGADQLNDDERRLSWSYVDYLMWLDPKKMPRLVSACTNDEMPTRDALREVYGLTVGQFIDGWLEFVRSEYSTRNKKGPIVRPPRGGTR